MTSFSLQRCPTYASSGVSFSSMPIGTSEGLRRFFGKLLVWLVDVISCGVWCGAGSPPTHTTATITQPAKNLKLSPACIETKALQPPHSGGSAHRTHPQPMSLHVPTSPLNIPTLHPLDLHLVPSACMHTLPLPAGCRWAALPLPALHTEPGAGLHDVFPVLRQVHGRQTG